MRDCDDIDFKESLYEVGGDDARREYGRSLAIDGLLKASFKKDNELVFNSKHPSKLPSITRFSKARNGSAWTVMTALFVVSLIAVGVTWVNFKQSDTLEAQLRVDMIEGMAFMKSGSGEIKELKNNDLIPAGYGVETESDGFVRFVYSDGSVVNLAEESILYNVQLGWFQMGKKLKVSQGEVKLDVAKQEKGSPFLISTPYAEAQVVGTEFKLAVCAGYSELSVFEGEVSFQRPESRTFFLVKDGQVSALGPDIETVETIDVSEPRIISFSMISCKTQEVIPRYNPLPETTVIKLSEMPDKGFNIMLNTAGRVSYVLFKRSDRPRVWKESFIPFSVAGDSLHRGGEYKPMNAELGKLSIEATPYDRDGVAGASKILELEILP